MAGCIMETKGKKHSVLFMAFFAIFFLALGAFFGFASFLNIIGHAKSCEIRGLGTLLFLFLLMVVAMPTESTLHSTCFTFGITAGSLVSSYSSVMNDFGIPVLCLMFVLMILLCRLAFFLSKHYRTMINRRVYGV